MKNITIQDLENQAKLLNYIVGNEEKPCYRNEEKADSWTGEILQIWNVGSFYISDVYGRYKLLRVTDKNGGREDVLSTGYTTKTDLYKSMRCFERGLLLRFIKNMVCELE